MKVFWPKCMYFWYYLQSLLFTIIFILAHLSQRLIGELLGYSWSGVRRRPPVRPQFQTSSPLKPLGQSKPKFYVEPPWEGGKKVYINGPCHMTKMAAMPIYGKNLKHLLLQNQMPYDLETWHVASVTQVLQSLYK